ncbi:SusC/RagA family TonB-linked outer membrane protein [Sphingobacterium sp.]|uniref:SusC/RagA family TonB-linked outer membrane protein n=1 Tax=Sphingobacterium sp. TaxID=341027 RepID=UPI002FDEE48C
MQKNRKDKPSVPWDNHVQISVNSDAITRSRFFVESSNDNTLPTVFNRKNKLRFHLVSALLTISLMQLYGTTNAQRISINSNKSSIKHVFQQLEKQSGYSFFYKDVVLEKITDTGVKFENGTLQQALDAILKPNGLDYEIVNKTVVIKPVSKPIQTNRLVSKSLQSYITGKILDENSKPIAGASIRLKSDEKKGVKSQMDGSFNLPLTSLNEVLVISSVGYEKKEVKASLNSAEMIIRLKGENTALEEVSIVSTGIFKKEDKSFTGASRTISAKELKQYGSRNLVTSLRNIDPSFNIIESNLFGSDPNRLPEIQMRGNASIPNVNQIQSETKTQLNTPLIVIDGFQTTLQALIDINENDVESITLLKDAAATALYGSRGANGVIVVTTRMPRPGKLRVTFGSELKIEMADLSGYHLLNARDKLELERRAGYYDKANAYQDIPSKSYYNFLLNEVNSGVETDWMAIPLRTSHALRNNLRLEGGDQQFRYSATLQNNNTAGVMKGSSRNTVNGSITLSYTYKNLLLRNYLNVKNVKSQESPYGTFSDYVKLNPYWRPYDVNGNVNKVLGDPGNDDNIYVWGTLPTNPLYNATLKTFDKGEETGVTNQTAIEWKIVKDLLLTGKFSFTKTNSQNDAFKPAEHTDFANYTGDDVFRKGKYAFGISNGMRYEGGLNLSYSTKFKEKHQFFAGAEANILQSKSSDYAFVAEGFPNANLDFPSMALQYEKGGKPDGAEYFYRTLGFVGNANYNYDNRYFVDGTFRYDGSSQFGSNKKFAPFWSAGIGWNMDEEKFFNKEGKINKLKLRGSIGTSGSTNFNTYQALTTYAYFTGDRYYNWVGSYLLGMGNPDLKWQQVMKYNIGTDIDLFNRYLLLQANYYIENTNDLVSAINTPASNGFSSYTANVGKLRNKGFEFYATVFLMKKPEGVTWSVSGTVLHNKNKIIETSEALKDAQKALQANQYNAEQMYIEGYSSNAIWVVKSLGIDPSTGKELYLSSDGSPTYTWNANDVTAVGNTDPKIWGSLNTMIRYKGLTFTAALSYKFGGQTYNQTLASRVETGNYAYNVDQRVYTGRWQKPGDIVPFKGLLNTTPTYKTSRFVQNENTFYARNFNVQYDFRYAKWVKKIGFENVNVGLNISDPFIISTIRQERGTSYPFSRQFTLSLNATF